jgi:hypothetical protein
VLEFTTNTDKAPVYCGVVYPGEIETIANPLRGIEEDYDFSDYDADDLNSGTPFIDDPFPVPRRISGTIDTNTLMLIKAFRELIRNVASRPMPYRVVQDNTTYWDMYARMKISPKMTYDGVYNSKQQFSLEEVL